MLSLLIGCGDGASDGDTSNSEDAKDSSNATSDGNDPSDSKDDDDSDSDAEDGGLGEGLFRLTHAQWKRSVEELFGLSSSVLQGVRLREDPQVNGWLFLNDSAHYEVDEALF